MSNAIRTISKSTHSSLLFVAGDDPHLDARLQQALDRAGHAVLDIKQKQLRKEKSIIISKKQYLIIVSGNKFPGEESHEVALMSHAADACLAGWIGSAHRRPTCFQPRNLSRSSCQPCQLQGGCLLC